MGLEDIYVNLNKQEIERGIGEQTKDRNKWKRIDETQTEMNKIGFERDRRQSRLKRDLNIQRWIDKRQKQIQVNKQWKS